MKKKNIIFILFIYLLSFRLVSQSVVSDSLKQALKTATNDTSRCNILNLLIEDEAEDEIWKLYNTQLLNLAEKNITTASPSLKKFYLKQIAISYKNSGLLSLNQGEATMALTHFNNNLKIEIELNDKKEVATTYNTIALIYQNKGDISIALEYYNNGLKIAQEIDYKEGIAGACNGLGSIYKNNGDIPKALSYYGKSLKIAEEIGDKTRTANYLNNIATLYYSQNEYAKALDYFNRSLKLREALKDKAGVASSLNNIGSILLKQNDTSKAENAFYTALKIQEKIGNKEGIAMSYNHLANLYQKNVSKALEYYTKSLTLRKEIEDVQGIANTLVKIGNLYLAQKDYNQATKYTLESMTYSKKIGFPASIKNAANQLSTIYKLTGNYKAAIENYELYITMRDSISNQENRKAAIRNQLQYEYGRKATADSIKVVNDKREVAIQLQHEKTQRIFLYAGLVLVLLFAGFMFNRFKVTQKQKHIIAKEKHRSEELLLNILPSEIAEELKQKGDAEAKLHHNVSVLFTDFKGFTQVSEKLTAKELIAELNYCFIAFDNIMHNYNIEKIKTIGDAYMAVCGLPLADDKHAQNSIDAAFDICSFMTTYKNERIAQNKPYFEVRIGIHSGDVVAGIVGVKKFAYDIWGDTVNIASRMESSGEPGKINISETTYQLVKQKYNCEPRGFIEAKGKGKLSMYFVTKFSA